VEIGRLEKKKKKTTTTHIFSHFDFSFCQIAKFSQKNVMADDITSLCNSYLQIGF
jgi:hypothetical protein